MGTIADKLEYLNDTKDAIKDALIAKGQSVSASDTFRSYAEKIGDISGGGGAKNILSGTDAPTSTDGSNGDIYLQYTYTSEQITDVSDFTKLYSTSIPFGSYGTKVNANLGLTNESTIASNMNGGWNASASAYYDAENQIGAYGGYDFGEGLYITRAKFWLGRYSGQNNNLTTTIEYLDGNGNWNEIEDFVVTTTLPYAVNVFEVVVNREVYGIRWIHKKTPNKTGGNNITFFGMSVYESTGAKGDIYTAYCKVNGSWQALEGTDIDDVNTEGGGGIPSGTVLPATAQNGDVFKLLDGNYYTIYVYVNSWQSVYSTAPIVEIVQIYGCDAGDLNVGDLVSSISLTNVDGAGGIVVRPISRASNIRINSAQNFTVQIGRCTDTATLPSIITAGDGRIDYAHGYNLALPYSVSVTDNSYNIFLGRVGNETESGTISFKQ